MRVQILSDIHFDVARPVHPVAAQDDVDLVIIAGDICEGSREGFAWLRERIPKTPVIAVAGNHTFYDRVLADELDDAREAAREFDVIFLENDTRVFGGLTFAGATLWTDYAVSMNPVGAMIRARDAMNDHRYILMSREPRVTFDPQDALRLHQESRAFIAQSGADVVVTHHAPTPRTMRDGGMRGIMINGAYASDLTDLIVALAPRLWVHGHVHRSADYLVDTTRVICNPMGYGYENREFDPQLVIEL